jgi:hypothetical protein
MDSSKIDKVILKLANQMREAIETEDISDFSITELSNENGIITITLGYPLDKLTTSVDEDTESLVDILSILAEGDQSLPIGASASVLLQGEETDEDIIRAFGLDIEHSELDNSTKAKLLQKIGAATEKVKSSLRDVLGAIVDFIRRPSGAAAAAAGENNARNDFSNALSTLNEEESQGEEGSQPELTEEQERELEELAREGQPPIDQETFKMMLYFNGTANATTPLEHRIDVFQVVRTDRQRIDGISYMDMGNREVFYSADDCISLALDEQEGETRLEKLNNLVGKINEHIHIRVGATEQIRRPSNYSDLDYAGGPFDFMFNRFIQQKPAFQNCSIISTIGDGTCLIHSLLISTCLNYRTIATDPEKGVIGRIIRRGLLPYLYLEEQARASFPLIKSSDYLDDTFLEVLCDYLDIRYIIFSETRYTLSVSLMGEGAGDFYLMYANGIKRHFSAMKNGTSFVINLPQQFDPIGTEYSCDMVSGTPFNYAPQPGSTEQYFVFKGGNFNEEGRCTEVLLFSREQGVDEESGLQYFIDRLLVSGGKPVRVPIGGGVEGPAAGAAEGAAEEGAEGAEEAEQAEGAAAEEQTGEEQVQPLTKTRIEQIAANPTMFAQMLTYIQGKKIKALSARNMPTYKQLNTMYKLLQQARAAARAAQAAQEVAAARAPRAAQAVATEEQEEE